MPPSPSHQSQQSHRSHQSHHSHFSLTSTEESVYASALPSPMFTNAHMANVLAADGSPYMVPPSVTFPGQTVEHLAEHRGKVEDQDPKLTLSPPSGSPTRPDSSCTGIMGARCSCSECN
jgi:hypothetical protein